MNAGVAAAPDDAPRLNPPPPAAALEGAPKVRPPAAGAPAAPPRLKPPKALELAAPGWAAGADPKAKPVPPPGGPKENAGADPVLAGVPNAGVLDGVPPAF